MTSNSLLTNNLSSLKTCVSFALCISADDSSIKFHLEMQMTVYFNKTHLNGFQAAFGIAKQDVFELKKKKMNAHY